MLHHPSGSARGQASDIQNEAKELLRIRGYVNKMLAQATGKSVERVCYIQHVSLTDELITPWFLQLWLVCRCSMTSTGITTSTLKKLKNMASLTTSSSPLAVPCLECDVKSTSCTLAINSVQQSAMVVLLLDFLKSHKLQLLSPMLLQRHTCCPETPVQRALLHANCHSKVKPLLSTHTEIVGDTCDLTFARQQIFVKKAAVVVQSTKLSYVQHYRLISSDAQICMAQVYA